MDDLTLADQAHRRELRKARDKFEAAAKALQEQIGIAQEDGLNVFVFINFRNPKSGETVTKARLESDATRVGVEIEATRRIV